MINATNSINSVNKLQMFNALNAFKPKAADAEEQVLQNLSDGIDVKDSNDILKNQDISEIKNIAQSIGEDKISDDDIKYGLTYGRSVIADYSA
jgi:hypothetical protein